MFEHGTIKNCYVNGNISGDSYTGGLVGLLGEGWGGGWAKANVRNSHAFVTIEGDDYVGGLVGFKDGGLFVPVLQMAV